MVVSSGSGAPKVRRCLMMKTGDAPSHIIPRRLPRDKATGIPLWISQIDKQSLALTGLAARATDSCILDHKL